MPKHLTQVACSSLEVEEQLPTPSTTTKVDWDLCALCQTDTRESLICPLMLKGTGYKYVAENLSYFQGQGNSPLSVELSQLDEGGGFE